MAQAMIGTYRVCREYARCSKRADVPSALHDVDGVNVVRIDDAGAAYTAQELGCPVDRDLLPREVAENGQRECDRRIDVTAGVATGYPNTEGCTGCPS